jgi:hypothetical protein
MKLFGQTEDIAEGILIRVDGLNHSLSVHFDDHIDRHPPRWPLRASPMTFLNS